MYSRICDPRVIDHQSSGLTDTVISFRPTARFSLLLRVRDRRNNISGSFLARPACQMMHLPSHSSFLHINIQYLSNNASLCTEGTESEQFLSELSLGIVLQGLVTTQTFVRYYCRRISPLSSLPADGWKGHSRHAIFPQFDITLLSFV